MKNWAAGHDGKGGRVHPDVQAAAAKNIAEWEAKKAKASGGSKRMTVTERADTKKPYGDVPYADPGYLDADGNQASKSGKPGVKRYPVTPDKVMAAWSYINQEKNAGQYTAEQLSAIKGRIKAAMKRHGHDVAEDSSSDSGRSESQFEFTRSVPFEDVSVGRDGRTVEAYAAVFNIAAPISDPDGQYEETLDPVVFNRAIANARPQGSRKGWAVGVFYNHGLTIQGTPSDRYSMPCGKVLDLQANQEGLWSQVRYHKTEVGEEVLENVRNDTPGGYSFSGRFIHSSPMVPRGGFRPDYRTGALPKVRRTESTLKELGWTPFPAYKQAAVTGMRAQFLEAFRSDPEFAMFVMRMTGDGIPVDLPDPLLPPGIPDAGPATGDPPVLYGHSGRSIRQDMVANRAAFLLRHRK